MLEDDRRRWLCATAVDAIRQPTLHFGFHPTHGARTDADPAREPAIGFELVDHRATQASDFADLMQSQNLQWLAWGSGVVGHCFDLDVWFRNRLDGLPRAAHEP